MRESKVRKYLHDRIKALGGEHRAMKWLGRGHAVDDFIMLPGRHVFVEAKRPGGEARGGQSREHDRLRAAGCEVVTLNTIAKIDAYFPPPTESNS